MLTLSLAALASLFIALLLLALVPGTSVLVVSSRAATSGFRQGAYATLGIVVADVLLILAAFFGFAVFSWFSPNVRLVVRLVFAFLLVRAGVKQIQRAHHPPRRLPLPTTSRSAASFAMGFLLTLIDVKAVVVYLGLLQAFVHPHTWTLPDVLAVAAIAIVAVGGAKLGYAFAAAKLEKWIGPRLGRNLVRTGGALRIAIGVWLAATAFGFGPSLEIPGGKAGSGIPKALTPS
jgi:threonine/homoserine/homoserine lactone efflux protein